TYKTCLRSYIGALPAADDPTAMMDKAQAVMDTLSSTVGDDEEGRRKLIAIYIGLARDLQRTAELAPDADKDTLSTGFETFLTRVSAGTTEFNVLAWVAETYFGMGRGFDTGVGILSAKASNYYQKSLVAYQKVLDRAGADPAITE